MDDERFSVLRVQSADYSLSLSEQATKNAYHKFVQNNLIIRQGLLDKKKVKDQHEMRQRQTMKFHSVFQGLFARRRMFLITEGPAIYYVDPEAMEMKGTISWCVSSSSFSFVDVRRFLRRTSELRIEQKDVKTFLIHVVSRFGGRKAEETRFL